MVARACRVGPRSLAFCHLPRPSSGRLCILPSHVPWGSPRGPLPCAFCPPLGRHVPPSSVAVLSSLTRAGWAEICCWDTRGLSKYLQNKWSLVFKNGVRG